ncbi:HAMP domain-containing sensor histidine kinase [uncultured Anaerococcus sp.]|uniref:sensor histidine kinase n=1 Tax=uncultured Anaerococcus sp. TaxID=293428 RepID=UPI00288AE6F7|nr:HAMP domain-containing sensor histidine kinase [uncultured Anaerococcus sp.]
MEKRVKNLALGLLLDNFLRVLVYGILTIIALKLGQEYLYPLRLKRDYPMGIFMIYSLYFLRKFYIGIDKNILNDLRILEESIKKDDYEKDLELAEFNLIAKTLKDKNEKIREKDSFIKTSLAAISHDMKTPLTVINTNLSLLKPIDLKNQARIVKIKGESEKIAAYIDDLMEVSGGFIDQISLEKISLSDFIVNLKANLSLFEDMREEKIGLINEINIRNKYYLKIDKIRFDKALSQLLTNAFEHRKSAVWIELNEKNGQIIITVADDGAGFDEKSLKDGKNLFYTDNYGRTSGKGTGMGLFIGNSYIEAMGGRLLLENKNGGRAKICLDLWEEENGK